MPRMSAAVTDSFDEFFAALAKDEVWGDVTFRLKAGKVVHISYQRDFLNLQDAHKGLTRKEEPGVHHANLHQNGVHSQAR